MRFVSSVACHVLRSVVSIGPKVPRARGEHRDVQPPDCFHGGRNSRRAHRGLIGDVAGDGATSTPAGASARSVSAPLESFASVRPAIVTAQPSRTSHCADPRPMPLPPPVMNAAFPARGSPRSAFT